VGIGITFSQTGDPANEDTLPTIIVTIDGVGIRYHCEDFSCEQSLFTLVYPGDFSCGEGIGAMPPDTLELTGVPCDYSFPVTQTCTGSCTWIWGIANPGDPIEWHRVGDTCSTECDCSRPQFDGRAEGDSTTTTCQ
jgi:hypothetical protein